MARQSTSQITINVTRKLHCTRLGEVDAIWRAQASSLSFEIRSLDGVASVFVDKAVLDVDVGNAGLLGTFAKEFV